MIEIVDGREVHITHTMADGRKLESVEGYVTNVDQLPPIAKAALISLLTYAKRIETEAPNDDSRTPQVSRSDRTATP